MKKTADLLLVLSGAVISASFAIILTVGQIRPYPNYPVFLLGNIAAISLFAFAIRQLIKRKRGILLFAAAGGLLFAYVASPWAWVMGGHPINSFYGHESNLAIAIIEFSIGFVMVVRGSLALARSN